jgi:nicotinamidase-related amidase
MAELKRPWMAEVDRTRMIELLNEQLTLRPRSTAVVAVDMHRGHLDPEVASEPVDPEAANSVVEHTRRLMDLARSLGMPVIHVVLRYRKYPSPAIERMASSFKVALDVVKQRMLGIGSTIREHNVEGSPQAQIHPGLGPVEGDLIIDNKKRLSAFYGTDLEILLRVLKVDTVLLCGVNTNTCVQCTAFEAANRDLQTVVVSDCVTSLYGADLHRFALENVARCFGWVLSVREVEEKLRAGMAAEGAPDATAVA